MVLAVLVGAAAAAKGDNVDVFARWLAVISAQIALLGLLWNWWSWRAQHSVRLKVRVITDYAAGTMTIEVANRRRSPTAVRSFDWGLCKGWEWGFPRVCVRARHSVDELAAVAGDMFVPPGIIREGNQALPVELEPGDRWYVGVNTADGHYFRSKDLVVPDL